MNEKEIEQMLRESCSPKMPGGMRERVLQRSFNELKPRNSNRRPLITCRWKPILACAAVLFVIFANISDTMLQERLAKEIGNIPAISVDTYLAWQKELCGSSMFHTSESNYIQFEEEDQL